jgi:uncharacterized protein YidB (DUF937 family)
MGLLDMLRGGSQATGRGGPSPMALALMAFLAYRAYQKQQAGTQAGGGGTAPGQMQANNPAGQPQQTGGGLGDILGGMLGGRAGTGSPAMPGTGGGGLGDLLRGGLGGLLGGAAAGTVLNGGLNDLLRRFQQNGFAEHADSWVNRGPNRDIDPKELEQAIGPDALQSFANETGKPYMQVLSELSQGLPATVDQLTPEGRVPTDTEVKQML